MNRIRIPGFVTAALLCISFGVAAQQPAPLNLKQKPKSINTALKPKEIHGDCKAVMDKEFKAYTDRVTRGLAAGVISATERADLEKEYNALKAKETVALKDGKVDPKECAALYDDLTDLNNHLGDTLCSREVPAAKQAEVGAAIKQAAQARVGNAPVTPNVGLGLCVMEVQHMVALFEASIQRGKQAGLIDAKEATDLEKSRAKLAADEKRAVSDKKISKAELKKMMDDIDAENKKLDAAMASPAAAAKAKPAVAHAPVVSWVQGVQPNAVVGGTVAGTPMHVCRAPMPNKEIHTGKEWKGNCYVEYGGKELKIPLASAEVLVITIPTAWVAAANGQVPPTALQSGVSGGAPMHVCRAKAPDGQTHPGKAWKGNCYIGYDGKGIKTPVFDVLTPATPGG